MNEDKNVDVGFNVFYNKLTDEEFERVEAMINPALVTVATEFENVETPNERRLRLDDENDAARITWMENEIVRLKKKRAEQKQNGFHIDPNRYYARASTHPLAPPGPEKIEINQSELMTAINSSLCPTIEDLCKMIDDLTDDENEVLAIEIKRQLEESGRRRAEELAAYYTIDWDKIAEEHDKQNPT